MHHLFTSLLFVNGLDPEVKGPFLKDNVATQKVNTILISSLTKIVSILYRSLRQCNFTEKILQSFLADFFFQK